MADLRRRQTQAEAQLVAGKPPPVVGTTIFPPGTPIGAFCLVPRGEAAAGTLNFCALCPPVCPAGNENGACVGVGPPAAGAVAAVVVVAFNRAQYLERMLASLLSVHARNSSNKLRFPLFVSQDFNASGVQDVVAQVYSGGPICARQWLSPAFTRAPRALSITHRARPISYVCVHTCCRCSTWVS